MAAAQALGLSADEIAARAEELSRPRASHAGDRRASAPIAFINDSKATNADAAAKALASFDTIYWIAGGIAKAGGITPLAEYFPRIAKAYLIGAGGGRIRQDASAASARSRCAARSTGRSRRRRAMRSRDGKPGAVVLLSPACASFDHYPNFEVRGDAFVRAVSRPGRAWPWPRGRQSC